MQPQNCYLTWTFLLTRPSRDVTFDFSSVQGAVKISTHTPLAGRDEQHVALHCIYKISTHTPLAGRDTECQWPS